MEFKVHNRSKGKETNLDQNSIHGIFSWTFLAMQIFGFMPLQGIFKRQLAEIYFSWKSFRTMYALITFVGLSFMLISQVIRFFIFKIEMFDVQRFWYFGKSWFVSLFFISLARDWKNFLIKWNDVDMALIKFGKPIYIKRKVVCLMTVFILLFIGDYILIQIQRIEEDILHGELGLNLKLWNHLQKHRRFKYIYDMYPYDFLSGICLLIIQLQILFSGTFLDLFIMSISLCLAARMKLITKRIQQASTCSNVPEYVWMDLREGYNRLELLCKYVNSKIGYAILVCFIGNLGVILIQLFNNFLIKRTFIQRSYLYYSFFFLLAKIVAVCIFGSKINDECKKPLIYLYIVEDSAYNEEIKRLIRQISRGNMALSGMNFFYLRRNMLLKIAGSIVTYELVLIQFAGDFLKEHHTMNRTTSL